MSKKPALLCIAAILCWIALAGPIHAGNKVVSATVTNQADLTWLAHAGSVEKFDPTSGQVRVYLSDAVVPELFLQGIAYEILIEDVRAWARAAIDASPKEPPTDAPVVLDHPLTYPEMQTFLFDLQTAHPDILSVTSIATTTSGNHELYLVKISDYVGEDQNEPELFFEGPIHGNEIAGAMLSLHMIEYLVQNYAEPDVAALVDDREIFFLPATNSDGLFAEPRSRYNYNGVDCNRDSGYMWHHSGGSTTPYGETETRVLFGLWAGNQFVFHTSWHSGALAFLYAWSCHYDPTPNQDEYDWIGQEYCSGNTQIDQWYQGAGLYGAPYHGSTKDSSYGSFGALAWSIELTDDKEPDWSIIEQTFEDNRPGILWLIKNAGYGIRGVITDASKGGAVEAEVLINGKWTAFSDPEVGHVHRYLLPGIYDITLRANGYAPQMLPGVVVAEGQATDISAALVPDPEAGTWAMKWLANFKTSDQIDPLTTHHALGPPDGRFFSLGFGQIEGEAQRDAFAVLDMGTRGVTDAPGMDLYVFEGHDDGDETIEVFASDTPFPDVWDLLGTGTGDCGFDLDAAGLSWIRYVKIVDRQPAIDLADAQAFDGYDLDAVGTLGSTDAPDDDDDNDDNDDNDDTSDVPLPDDDDDDRADSSGDESDGCCG